MKQVYVARLKNGESLKDIEESDFFFYLDLLDANEENGARMYIDELFP